MEGLLPFDDVFILSFYNIGLGGLGPLSSSFKFGEDQNSGS
jgi:hypothetical protein